MKAEPTEEEIRIEERGKCRDEIAILYNSLDMKDGAQLGKIVIFLTQLKNIIETWGVKKL